jgi:DNA mismatch repair protein MutH
MTEDKSGSEYDKTSPESIYEHALKLTGKTLEEAVTLPENVVNEKNRGDLGSLVEKYFFKHQPPNTSDPDFPEAGLELKTTGLFKDSKGNYKAKERLVLTMINYQGIVKEDWDTSSFLKKSRLMLILFYLFNKSQPVHRRRFVLKPLLYRISTSDLNVIKNDWQLIRKKVLEGRAHELSEGDTFYLGACRKGSGGPNESLQVQPFSNEPAKTRAFSFKQGFVNKLLTGHLEGEVSLLENSNLSLEEATLNRFSKYLDLSIQEISTHLNYFKKNENHKGFHRDLANRILSNSNQSVVELEKAGIELKTVRVNRNGKPRESMSFPAFKFMKIINEEWEDSSFFEKLEKKFLFVIFQEDLDGVEKLTKAMYWNMPYLDRMEAKRVWEKTKFQCQIDAKNLPKISDSPVAHVRPKARDGNDKELTPQGEMHLKQCFWLNASYIAKVIESL